MGPGPWVPGLGSRALGPGPWPGPWARALGRGPGPTPKSNGRGLLGLRRLPQASAGLRRPPQASVGLRRPAGKPPEAAGGRRRPPGPARPFPGRAKARARGRDPRTQHPPPPAPASATSWRPSSPRADQSAIRTRARAHCARAPRAGDVAFGKLQQPASRTVSDGSGTAMSAQYTQRYAASGNRVPKNMHPTKKPRLVNPVH